jgi:NADH-quinone oxidoreductase subunit D
MARRTLLPIGPFHPLQEEPEHFQLYVDGETIVDMDVRISYNHRGIEKLSESKTFDQVPFLVERVCGICSASHPMAYICAVEDIAGVQAPLRSEYLRTIVLELERIHSHLLWAGLAGHFIGYNTVFMWAWKYREPVMDILEYLTGSRVEYANAKIGGSRRDMDDELAGRVRKDLDEIEKGTYLLTKAVLDDPVLAARLKGACTISYEQAVNFGMTGPSVRASGVPIDVRHDDPYCVYDQVDWEVITTPNGDVFDKVVVRLLETFESIKIVRQCLDQMPEGEIDAKVQEVPPGEAVGHVEAPRGETFHYVRSDGGNGPARHKIRAPSYVNVPSFKASSIGQPVADVTIAMAALDPCYSCTERMVVAVDADSGKPRYGWNDLVRLSQEKTRRLMKKVYPTH